MDIRRTGSARIALAEAARVALGRDPRIRLWSDGASGGRVPLPYYCRRSYTTLHDGTVFEHGDGFSLSFIDPQDARDTDRIVYVTVAFTNEGDLLVGGNRSVLSGSFTIDRSGTKFTFEPRGSE